MDSRFGPGRDIQRAGSERKAGPRGSNGRMVGPDEQSEMRYIMKQVRVGRGDETIRRSGDSPCGWAGSGLDRGLRRQTGLGQRRLAHELYLRSHWQWRHTLDFCLGSQGSLVCMSFGSAGDSYMGMAIIKH